MPKTEPSAGRSTRSKGKVSALSLLVAVLAMGAPDLADARPPLAASQWLEDGATRPPIRESSGWRPGLGTPPDAKRPSTREPRPRHRPEASPDSGVIGISRLDGPDPDAAGIAMPEDVDLPRDFWADMDAKAAIRALSGTAPRLPVLGAAYRHVLTAQLEPPLREEGAEGEVFLARVDALMAMGAVDLAAALIDAVGIESRPIFARRMDAALLFGDERRLCSMLSQRPGLAPDIAARIFCLAQAGDWPTASLALTSARLTEAAPDDVLVLLGAFLDDAQVDEGNILPAPNPMTPLAFRLLEAVGQPMPTTNLPVQYAMADLRANTGWKPRIEAAERLARSGNLSTRHLRAIYAEQPPAASGGVWDRVAAVQKLEVALRGGDSDQIADRLTRADHAMREGGLTAAFAQMFALDLLAADLGSKAGRRAVELALISANPDAWAMLNELPLPKDTNQAWLQSLAHEGTLPDQGAPDTMLGTALAEALTDTPPSPAQPHGQAFLDALRDLDAGREGDAPRAGRGVMGLRSLGHENLARAAALQLLLLPASNAVP